MSKARKILAAILAIAMVASMCSFVMVSADEEETYFDSPSVSEAELFEFTNKSSGAIKQNNPNWRYGYMPVDGTVDDFVEYKMVENQESPDRDDSYWICDESGNDAVGGNKKTGLFWLPYDAANGSAAVFTVPRDGEITLEKAGIRAREDENANPAGSDMLMTVYLNDTQIFPESGSFALPAGKSVTFSGVTVSAKKDDKLVILFNCEAGRTNVEYVPAVSYPSASDSDVVVGEFTVVPGEKIYQPILRPDVSFDMINKSSGKLKQTSPIWRFGYMPVDGTIDDFIEFNQEDTTYEHGEEYWLTDASGDMIGGNKKDGRTWTPADDTNCGVSVFTVPTTGTITITNEALPGIGISTNEIFGIEDINANPASFDSNFRILHNDEKIFPADTEWLTLAEGERYTLEPITLEVEEGDVLEFQHVVFGAGSRTNIYTSPVITYAGDTPVAPVEPVTPVETVIGDVADEHWAAAYIKDLVNKGVMSVEDGKFEPERNITREEFISALMLAFDLVDETATDAFADVPADSKYFKAIASAKKLGVTTGTDGVNFGMGEEIERQALSTLIYRALINVVKMELPAVNEQVTFADDANIQDYAKEAVYAMQKAGIVNGKGDNMFAPIDQTTRAETAKILGMLIAIKG